MFATDNEDDIVSFMCDVNGCFVSQPIKRIKQAQIDRHAYYMERPAYVFTLTSDNEWYATKTATPMPRVAALKAIQRFIRENPYFAEYALATLED